MRRTLALLIITLGSTLAADALARPPASCRWNPDADVCCTEEQPRFAANLCDRPALSSAACVTRSTGPAVVRTGLGDDFVATGDGKDTILTRLGDDTVVAGAGDDQIDTGIGDDVVYAGPGNDSVDGGPGDDALYGEDGNDVMRGGLGDDILYPGRGVDVVDGGPGNDYVVLTNLCELQPGKRLDGGLGQNTLVTPLPVSELRARGITVQRFSSIVVYTHPDKFAECTDAPLRVLSQPRTFTRAADGSVSLSVEVDVQPLGVTPPRSDAPATAEFHVTSLTGAVLLRAPATFDASSIGRKTVTATIASEDLPRTLSGSYPLLLNLSVWDSSLSIPSGAVFISIPDLPERAVSPPKQKCILAGHESVSDRVRYPNNSFIAGNPYMYGTDLGFPVWNPQANEGWFFFGDTWETDGPNYASEFFIAPILRPDNDSLGRTPALSSSTLCKKGLEFSTDQAFHGITEVDNPTTLGEFRTPASAFVVDGRVFMLGSETKPTWDPMTVRVGRQTGGTAAPTSFDRVGQAFPKTVNIHCPLQGSAIGVGLSSRFVAPMTWVPSEAQVPASELPAVSKPVLVWGRPWYTTEDCDAASKPAVQETHLMVLDGSQLITLNNDQTPLTAHYRTLSGWSTNSTDSVPVIAGEPQASIGFGSVMYVATISKWLMIYGGRTNSEIDSPEAGVLIRSADHPWGPWGEARRIYSSSAEPGACQTYFRKDNFLLRFPSFEPGGLGGNPLKWIENPFGCVGPDRMFRDPTVAAAPVDASCPTDLPTMATPEGEEGAASPAWSTVQLGYPG